MHQYKVVFVSMSGVRVYNSTLLSLGLTLPGFVERSQVIASLPSLGLLTLAAHTPTNWEIIYREFDDCTDGEILSILDENPDIIAISSLTARISETYRFSDLLRSRGATVVLGGLHVSAMPQEALLHADAVVQGEGERIWPVLIKDYETNNLKPLYNSMMNPDYTFHLTESKVPRYDLLDISNYNRITLQTTRGCPLNCSFCAASRTISAYKKKPIDQIARELDAIFEIWDRPFIELADDNTFVDKKWSKELLKLFATYNLRWFTETDISVAYDEELLELLSASNCAQVLIGFETANLNSLDGLDRANWKYKQFDTYYESIDKIQSYGISVNGCFILGFDTDTQQTFIDTDNFIKESNLSEVQITLLTAFPGTDLFRKLEKENRLIKENLWEKCTLFDVNFIPKNFTIKGLEDEFQRLMSSIYDEKEVLKRKRYFRKILKNNIG